LTALFSTIALFLYGGAVIHGFAFTMLVGIIAGVYSTIFIASPIVILIQKKMGKTIKPSSELPQSGITV
jgi:preprotein translocase subunit SecF